MADTALKFGPEWMRALCDRGPSTQNQQQQQHHQTSNVTASPTFHPPPTQPSNVSSTRYKLAEYRYGREEMLALFETGCFRPHDQFFRDNPSLATNECQKPLTLNEMSDEEQRILSRSANSDSVLRQNNKDRGPPPQVNPGRPNDRPPRTVPGPSGRGMGPGGRTVPRGFQPRSFDEDIECSERRVEFPRPEKRVVASESERERPSRVSESEEGPKQRKNDSRASTESNWRGSRSSAADTDNWRSRHDKTESIAWKDRPSRWRDDDEDQRSGPKSRFGYSREHWVNGDDDIRNSVPEWSLDDVGTSIGTFDASGAFMAESPGEELGGALEDEDDDGEWTKVGQDKRRPRRDSDREQQRNQNRNGNRNRYERSEYEKSSYKENPQSENYRSDKHEKSSLGRTRSDFDDDCFATSIEQHAEHLVAKWTEEDDENDTRHRSSRDNKSETIKPTESVYPPNHPDAKKWFYRDPQNAIQGPFTSQEMLGWLKEGYFQPDLLVRRGCDDDYSQLGQLMSAMGRNPFEEPKAPAEVTVMNKQNQLLQLLGHQQHQQKQLQMAEMQNHLSQLLENLKRQEGFNGLSEQDQQQILLRNYAQHIEQMQPHHRAQGNVNPAIHQQVHQQQQQANSSGLPSIWELTNGGVMTASALEEMQRQEQEKRELEERRMMLEAEHRRRMEAEARAIEEENQRKMREVQKKLEEERKANEERVRLQQEEERRKLREDEERRIMEEKKKVEEQRRRNEEIRRLNEEMARKQMEAEAEKRKEEEMEKFRQQEHERQRIKQQELERLRQHQQQQEALRRMREREPKGWGSQPQQQQIPTSQMTLADIQRLQEEKELEERARVQMQQQQVQAMYEHQMKLQKSQTSWPNSSNQSSSHVKTLAEIQKEEADRLSKLKRDQEMRDRENSAMSNVGIWSNASSQLSWKSKSPTSAWSQQNESASESSPQRSSSSGFWADDEPPLSSASSSQRNKPSQSAFDNNSSLSDRRPITSNSSGASSVQASGRGGKDRKPERKKEKNDEFTDWCEDALTKFQSSLDGEKELSLSLSYNTFVNYAKTVPTFVAFLKGLESPFDVNDYIRSYLGENKESREFAKNFLEKRSYYRNQGKKKEEESMWGPAPAITPSVNKNSAMSSATSASFQQPQPSPMTNVPSAATSNNNNNTDGGDLNSKVKSKKKKSKRVLDTSLLGFTVQADPERINAGQIEHLE